MREVLCAVLRAEHYAVDGVAFAEEVTPGDPYALVLADVPIGQTSSACAQALSHFGTEIVLMSSNDEDDEDDEVLHKPFDRRSLVTRISLTQARRSRDS